MFRSEREAMHFYASPSVAWFLPAASGLTIGIFVGALVGLVSQSFLNFLITTFSVAIPVWCYLTWQTFGKVGLTPQKHVQELRLVIEEEGGKKLTIKRFVSVDRREFVDICRYIIIDGGTLSIRNLRSLGLGESKVNLFRRELVGERMAVIDTNGEIKLTPSGKKYMEGYAPYPNRGGDDA